MREACQPLLFCLLYYIIFIIYYLSLSACSGSMREASCGSMMPAISKHIVRDFVYIYKKCTAAHYRAHYHMMSHTAAHCCRTHHRTQPRALTHTAARTAIHNYQAHCHTLPYTLPHTATQYCTLPRVLSHTVTLPHTAALPHTHCRTAVHCRTLPHTAG
jgi:hypothetical protein